MSAPAGMPGEPGRFVVDASVAIKWFVPEIHTGAARRLLREGVILLAPDLIWAEVANALWRKWREKELAADTVEGILSDFRRYPLRIHTGESLYEVVWPVAQESGRTFYDCLYLALAISKGCLMVTADLRFCNVVQDTPWGGYCLWVEDVL